MLCFVERVCKLQPLLSLLLHAQQQMLPWAFQKAQLWLWS